MTSTAAATSAHWMSASTRPPSAPKAADHPELAVIKTFLKIGSAFELTGAAGGNIIVHNTETEPREWREDRDYLYPLPLSQIQFAPDKIKQNPNW